jgi:hypothetical protein
MWGRETQYSIQEHSLPFARLAPPSKSNQALLRKKSPMMLYLLNLYNQEIEKNKQTYAGDKHQDNLDATTNRINSAENDDQDKDIKDNLRTSALPMQSKPLKVCSRLSGCLRMRNRRQDFPWCWELGQSHQGRRVWNSWVVISNLVKNWCPRHKVFGVILVARGRCVVVFVSRRLWFTVVSNPSRDILLWACETYEVREQRKFCHKCKKTPELVASIALTCCCRKCRPVCWSNLDIIAFGLELRRSICACV